MGLLRTVVAFSVTVAGLLGGSDAYTPAAMAMKATVAGGTGGGAAAPQAKKKRIVVLGGTGYVGSKVVELLSARGHAVTSLSRRGTPAPSGGGEDGAAAGLPGVTYVAGDATDGPTVQGLLADCDGVVHAVGLLFDASTPGGGVLNLIVSGSNSRPDPEASTYDAITRLTACHVVDALNARQDRFPPLSFAKQPLPTFCFVSAAEAGWPEVRGGKKVEALAPSPLKRYLAAKRTVEHKLLFQTNGAFRPVIFRPSLIWDMTKLDVLPLIPIFNAAAALGVPFVDKTVRVEVLAASIVRALEDDEVVGVQRVGSMERLAEALDAHEE